MGLACATVPDAGEVSEVCDGVLWLRMPLPLKLDHVNLWLLRDRDGWTVVDTGLNSERLMDLWRGVFRAVLAPLPIRRIIVTHFHPDHIGLAGWLAAEWPAELWMSQAEWLYARMFDLEPAAENTQDAIAFYRTAGCPEGFLEDIRRDGPLYAYRVSSVPRRFRRLSDGMSLEIGGRSWRVIVGRGHSPEHVSLYCESLGILISGDQILPRITPNVGVYPEEPEANPLHDYLVSLDRFRPLPADLLVLPSHNEPFRGLQLRLDELAAHHVHRLAAILDLCAEPQTAMGLSLVLYRRVLDRHQVGLAIAETIAHLHLLIVRGQLRRRRSDDGVYHYTRVGRADSHLSSLQE